MKNAEQSILIQNNVYIKKIITMYNWTQDELIYFAKVCDAISRGFIVNGKELTDLYNRVFNRNLTPTNCATCLRGRYNELKANYDIYLKIQNQNIEQTQEVSKPKTEELVQVKKVTRKKSKNA